MPTKSLSTIGDSVPLNSWKVLSFLAEFSSLKMKANYQGSIHLYQLATTT
jgi:hypothetical protein